MAKNGRKERAATTEEILSAADPTQAERIEKLKNRIDEMDGELMLFNEHEADMDMMEQFLSQVVIQESSEWKVPLEELTQGGLDVAAPDEVAEEHIPAKLRELLLAMALHHIYVLNTDHLTDRELYTRLVEEELREETAMGPPVPGSNFIIDLVGSGSDEDTDLMMRFYADDEYRRQWQNDFPDYAMPPSERPPFDRDRFLPQPSWDLTETEDLVM